VSDTPKDPDLLEVDESEFALSEDLAPEGDSDASDAQSERALVPTAGSSLIPHDPLSRYFSEIGHYPLLSRDEEKALAILVHDEGDTLAAEKLVLSNLRLVVKIAMDYRRVWTNLLDLIQEGNVGLLQGVKRYDPYRGVKLSSYVAYWIRAYILKYLIDNIRLVRVGSSRAERKLFFQLNRARRELQRAGFAPEPKQLAEKLGVEESDVIDMEQRLSSSDLSMDAPAHDDEGSASFGDFIASTDASVEASVADHDLRATFRHHVMEFGRDLDERETVILEERILADDPKTLQEIGDQFGLTRERVRQIEKKLIERLRRYLEENLVDFELYAPS
jgi:RNA polymerase sigma-32 factor